MSGESAYVRELAEAIGPRPATTDAEARAADWLTAVMEAKGLQVQRQEIDTPRTESWGLFIGYVLAIVAAGAAFFPMLRIACLVVAIVAAAIVELDLLKRFSLASILPKGPSQNVIAKHVPRTGRNERARKVIVVANLDSARPSIITNTWMVRSQRAITLITLAAVWLIVFFLLATFSPWKIGWEQWLWYITLVPAVWLLFPIVVILQRELIMKASPGANANASGVAAMVAVVDRLIPDKADATVHVEPTEPVRQGEDVVWAADLVPEDATLSYAPGAAPARGAEQGAEDSADELSDLEPERSGAAGLDIGSVPDRRARTGSISTTPPLAEGDKWADTGTIEWTDASKATGGIEMPSRRGGRETAPPPDIDVSRRHPVPLADDDLLDDAFADLAGPSRRDASVPPSAGGGDAKSGLFGDIEPPAPTEGKGAGKDEEKNGVLGWLGVDRSWDARKKGREIGSWEKFDDEEDHDDPGSGFKGGEVPEDDDSGGTESLWDQPAPEPVGQPVYPRETAPAATPRPSWSAASAPMPSVPEHTQPTMWDSPAARGDAYGMVSGPLDVDDPNFTDDEIARIRRKVTQGVDRDLTEKEIWFVGTGAGEVGGYGMKEFIRSNADDLRDAYVIGLYCVGTGALAYVDEEGGPVGKVRADRRMVTTAKRVAREHELPVKSRTSRWTATDVFVARRAGIKAMSIMAFDINGRLGEWRSLYDTADSVNEEAVAAAADFVTALIRDL